MRVEVEVWETRFAISTRKVVLQPDMCGINTYPTTSSLLLLLYHVNTV